LQHQDGTSHLLASTIQNCVAYDPCFGYELAVILHDGMRRMLERQEDVFYYVTVMNENYAQPPLPAGAEEGIRRGIYLLRPSKLAGAGAKAAGGKKLPRVRLLGAGTILREALAAAEILEQEYDIAADVWSVTSFTELRRDGIACEQWNREHPGQARQSWLEQCLAGGSGPVIAASDYVRAVPDLVRAWVPGTYVTLGTDGFGRSDTRAALRGFFGVDAQGIAQAAVRAVSSAE
ncbi:MAG: pyruvate dehydrogenase (acetyl-transferring), homodimeric type, partial [Hylemonella sp.]|nr:pyruvate dehydrogenase (acetyl-transferring), homodimeric type [Hylemonella sp.]